MVLKPLHDAFGLKSVVLSTYQSLSGAGRQAVESHREAWISALTGGHDTDLPAVFDVCPQIGELNADGYTGEESKIIKETRKILNLPALPVMVTAVRVPVEVGHAESMTIETEKPMTQAAVTAALASFPGVSVCDHILTPKHDGVGICGVKVGRIRVPDAHHVQLWSVADNLLKGAAYNSVQIANLLPTTVS